MYGYIEKLRDELLKEYAIHKASKELPRALKTGGKRFKKKNLKFKKKFWIVTKSLLLVYVWNLTTMLGNLFQDIRIIKKDIEIITTINDLRILIYFLQKHTLCLYTQLRDITCIDTLTNNLRFTLVYNLYSVQYNSNIFISIQIDEGFSVPTITPLYASANWLEREIWDLFGIFFFEHPDLRRILTDYGFNGHALRKDFPLTGFTEIYYNDSTKRLFYEPVQLTQELYEIGNYSIKEYKLKKFV